MTWLLLSQAATQSRRTGCLQSGVLQLATNGTFASHNPIKALVSLLLAHCESAPLGQDMTSDACRPVYLQRSLQHSQ